MGHSSLVENRYTPLRPVRRSNGLGLYLSTDTLVEELASDLQIWNDRKCWLGPLYFGKGDRRLYVPRRLKRKGEHPSSKVLNLCHPLARLGAIRILFGYFILLTAVLAVVGWRLGVLF